MSTLLADDDPIPISLVADQDIAARVRRPSSRYHAVTAVDTAHEIAARTHAALHRGMERFAILPVGRHIAARMRRPSSRPGLQHGVRRAAGHIAARVRAALHQGWPMDDAARAT